MKHLTKLIFAPVLIILWGACTKPGTGTQEQNPEKEDRTLYYSALEFDPSYDWKKDSLGGAVDTRLVLYKDHERIAQVEISAAEHLSGSCELHRIFGGALYSVHDISGYTIVRKNGEYATGWEGREIMEDFMVVGGDIHSLSSDPGGCGVTYRINERVVLREPQAYLEGGLYTDMGQVCFAYRRGTDKKASLEADEYFLCYDGVTNRVEIGASVVQVLALRRSKGVIHMLTKESGTDGIVWSGGKLTKMICPDGCTAFRDCGFVGTGKGICVHFQGKVRNESWDGMTWNDFFWDSAGMHSRTKGTEHVVSHICGKSDLCYATSSSAGTGKLCVRSGGASNVLPEQYSMISPFALCEFGGSFAIGVNNTAKNNRPVVIVGADAMEMDFNGYFTRFALP